MTTKFFRKTVKPFLSDKIVSKEQFVLIENDKIIIEESDVTQSLNSFFLSIVINLKISEYTGNNSNSENITDPIIKVILKYRNHPSILTIGEVSKERSTSLFVFSVIKGNADIFRKFYCIQGLMNLTKILNFHLF